MDLGGGGAQAPTSSRSMDNLSPSYMFVVFRVLILVLRASRLPPTIRGAQAPYLPKVNRYPMFGKKG